MGILFGSQLDIIQPVSVSLGLLKKETINPFQYAIQIHLHNTHATLVALHLEQIREIVTAFKAAKGRHDSTKSNESSKSTSAGR